VAGNPYGLVGVCPLCPEGLAGLTQGRFDDGTYLFTARKGLARRRQKRRMSEVIKIGGMARPAERRGPREDLPPYPGRLASRGG
jgi:hypothetical protein